MSTRKYVHFSYFWKNTLNLRKVLTVKSNWKKRYTQEIMPGDEVRNYAISDPRQFN